jgi:hypothetical protein
VQLDPRSVVNVTVGPTSGQPLFCPGDAFQVELVARLKDGTSCSSTDPSRGCMGQSSAVIDPADIRIEGNGGALQGPREKFVWMPESDPLKTADTGLTLRGWLEKVVDGRLQKSMVGERELKPVYQCHMEGVFQGPPPPAAGGQDGQPGPELRIAVTTLSTPYYPAAALIRVETGTTRVYYISPSADQPVRLVSKGSNGTPGANGANGAGGTNGEDAPANAAACTKGGDATDGGPGGPGANGGSGGPGGLIRISFDANAADKLRGRILAASVGGDPGHGGMGGVGGIGGWGGSGGPTGPDCAETQGKSGKNGDQGTAGAPGRPGPNGPDPVIEAAPRESLFGTELAAISRIEAAKAKR